MSEIIAVLLGMLNAIIEPLTIPMTNMCQKAIRSVISSRPSTTLVRPFPAAPTIIIRLREILSANTPPMADTTVTGMANETMTIARAKGESLAILSTSQLRVIIPMFMAIREAKELIHTQRKSRYLRDSSVSNLASIR